MIIRSLLIALLTSIAESRIKFSTSEVLDDVDLKGTNTATFRCYAGCRVYSPTRRDNTYIYDSAGKKWASLMDLANLKTGEFFELPESTDLYTLKNEGAGNPSFILYAVEKGALNYDTKVLYLQSASQVTVKATMDSLLTVLSSSGTVSFANFRGDFTDAIPAVYAAGFDALIGCRPLFSPLYATTVGKSVFTVYSPMATIDFKKAEEGKSVLITGNPSEYAPTAAGEYITSVYVSPGYVGCSIVGDSLYTSLTNLAGFDESFKEKDSNGISIIVSADYTIANEADALTVTINNDVEKLYGKNNYFSRTYYEATSAQIGVKWSKKNGSKDNFALQIDVLGPGATNVATTTKSESTTSSSRSLTIIPSLIVLLSSVVMMGL